MKYTNLNEKVFSATKWSSITEIAAKLVSPVTNMILARILAPEAFGVVATVTMIFSFADMLTDAGFQKYLVQHDFKDENEIYKNANVAFWTNFGISFFLWFIIIIFREQIATLVGNPGKGNVIAIACAQLLLTPFSSIQMALYKRNLDFKTLFFARMVGVCIPFAITTPLALIGLSYWALIIGTVTMQLSNAVILTFKSKWKPKLFYNVSILREMISFSIWSLVEAISIWLSIWADTFAIGSALNPYYLGLYKTSTSMVNVLNNLITASIVSILFSTLSRLQHDNERFTYFFLKVQRIISVLIFPLGVGVYLYRDLATQILLGDQWGEASTIIGIWALTRSIKIVLGDLCSEVYRSKGKPKLSFMAQVMHLVVLIPTCLISVRYGFWSLVYARSLIQMQFVLVHFIMMKFAFKFSILTILKNIFPTGISAVAMYFFGYVLQHIHQGVLWSLISIFLCAMFYFGILFLFPGIRKEVLRIVKRLIPQKFTRGNSELQNQN